MKGGGRCSDANQFVEILLAKIAGVLTVTSVGRHVWGLGVD